MMLAPEYATANEPIPYAVTAKGKQFLGQIELEQAVKPALDFLAVLQATGKPVVLTVGIEKERELAP